MCGDASHLPPTPSCGSSPKTWTILSLFITVECTATVDGYKFTLHRTRDDPGQECDMYACAKFLGG